MSRVRKDDQNLPFLDLKIQNLFYSRHCDANDRTNEDFIDEIV